MCKTMLVALAAAGVTAVATTETGRNATLWPYRKVQLERGVTLYILTCFGDPGNREARRQARQVILDGPYNPFNPSRED